MLKIKEYFLPFLIGLCALSVSASAAIYSVTGLSKLFAGASFQVMVMAGSLEVAKLVIATLLHQYWNTLNKLLKVYLTLAVVVLVLITSMGIYGFLSSAYQNTSLGFETASKEIAFLKQKEAFYQKDLDRYDEELNRISNSIAELSKAKAREITVSDGRGGTTTSVSTTELRLADSRIRSEETTRESTLQSRTVVADSLKNIQTKILNLEVKASSNAELGPLIYLSELTGRSMDEIINILLLVIIFVFDPLAISLVLAANFAFDKVKNKVPVTAKQIDPPKIIEPKPAPVKRQRKKRKFTKTMKTNNKTSKKKAEKEVTEEPTIIQEQVQEQSVETPTVEQEIDMTVVEEVVESLNDIPLNVKPEPPQTIHVHNLPPDIDYTFADIVKILQNAPSYYAILLRNGRRTRINKADYEELKRRSSL